MRFKRGDDVPVSIYAVESDHPFRFTFGVDVICMSTTGTHWTVYPVAPLEEGECVAYFENFGPVDAPITIKGAPTDIITTSTCPFEDVQRL